MKPTPIKQFVWGLALLLFSAQGVWAHTGDEFSPLAATTTSHNLIQIFARSIQGGMVFAGNTLGLTGLDATNGPGTSTSCTSPPPSSSSTRCMSGDIHTFTKTTLGVPLNDNSPSASPAYFTGTPSFGPSEYTTNAWASNSSTAYLQIPTGAEVVQAYLLWGGSYYTSSSDASATTPTNENGNLNVSVSLTGPDGVIRSIAAEDLDPDPDPLRTTSHTVRVNTPTSPSPCWGDTAASPNPCEYVRLADVTPYVTQRGNYTVGGVPGTQGMREEAADAVGWTLMVVYRHADLPARNLTIYMGMHLVGDPNNGGSFSAQQKVEKFCTLPSGSVTARLLVTSIEGDSSGVGDNFVVGPTGSTGSTGPLSGTNLSGANNPVGNFFTSQVNNTYEGDPVVGGGAPSNGALGFNTISGTPTGAIHTFSQTTGATGPTSWMGGNATIGDNNGSAYPIGQASRYGWDITSVPLTTLTNNQSELWIQGTSALDRYGLTAVGIQITTQAPLFFQNTSVATIWPTGVTPICGANSPCLSSDYFSYCPQSTPACMPKPSSLNPTVSFVGAPAVEFTVLVANAGFLTAENVRFFYPLAPNYAYVSGSLTVTKADNTGTIDILPGWNTTNNPTLDPTLGVYIAGSNGPNASQVPNDSLNGIPPPPTLSNQGVSPEPSSTRIVKFKAIVTAQAPKSPAPTASSGYWDYEYNFNTPCVTADLHAGTFFSASSEIFVVPDNTFFANGGQTVAPNNVVFYPHTFITGITPGVVGCTVGSAGDTAYPPSGDGICRVGVVTFTGANIAAPPGPPWNHQIYRDTNCNGVLDGTEGATPIAGTPITVEVNATVLNQGTPICIVVKEFVPATATIGAVDTVTITATFDPDPITAGTPDCSPTVKCELPTDVMTLTDITIAGPTDSGQLRLTKRQALDALCDGIPDTAYSSAVISTASIPGACIRYEVTATNVATTNITGLIINDFVPTDTTYHNDASTPPGVSAAVTGGTVNTVTCEPPTAGSCVGAGPSGDYPLTIIANVGTLTPSASAVLTYGVKINPCNTSPTPPTGGSFANNTDCR